MEKITFAFSSESIRNSFYHRGDERNILQLPFFFKEWIEASFTVNNIDEKNIINIKLNIKKNIKEVIKVLERPLPEIFNCDEILIECYDGVYSIKRMRDFIKKKENTFFKDINQITAKSYNQMNIKLIGYGSKRFNAIFNKENIIAYIANYCSLNYLNSKKIIKFKYFNNKFEVEKSDLLEIQKQQINYKFKKIEDENFLANIKLWNNLNRDENIRQVTILNNDIRINDNLNVFLKEIEKNLSKSFVSNVPQFERYISFEIVINLKKIDLDEKFHIVNNDKIEKVNKLINKKLHDKNFLEKGEIVKYSEELSLQRQVEKLNLRKKKLSDSKKIYLNDNVIFREPQNEQETVLLFIKLASLNATPLTYVNVLEYSTSEGIDAIANIQLDASSPVEKDCLVEFEPTFGQFIQHKHPPKHVDYIICWKIENHFKKSLRSNNDWLYSFNLENYPKEVKVVEISKFNNIKVV